MDINEKYIENEALRLIPLSVIGRNFNISKGFNDTRRKINHGIDVLMLSYGFSFKQTKEKLKEFFPEYLSPEHLELAKQSYLAKQSKPTYAPFPNNLDLNAEALSLKVVDVKSIRRGAIAYRNCLQTKYHAVLDNSRVDSMLCKYLYKQKRTKNEVFSILLKDCSKHFKNEKALKRYARVTAINLYHICDGD